MQAVDEAQLNVLLTIGHREGGPKLLARITRRAQRLLNFRPGQDVYAQVKAVSLVRDSDKTAPPVILLGEKRPGFSNAS